MPFDGNESQDNLRATLTLLAEVLRGGPQHPLWPAGHKWDFHLCEKCALGIASKIFPEYSGDYMNFYRDVSAKFGIKQSNVTFTMLGYRGYYDPNNVTPEVVADAIERNLLSQTTVFTPA